MDLTPEKLLLTSLDTGNKIDNEWVRYQIGKTGFAGNSKEVKAGSIIRSFNQKQFGILLMVNNRLNGWHEAEFLV